MLQTDNKVFFFYRINKKKNVFGNLKRAGCDIYAKIFQEDVGKM